LAPKGKRLPPVADVGQRLLRFLSAQNLAHFADDPSRVTRAAIHQLYPALIAFIQLGLAEQITGLHHGFNRVAQVMRQGAQLLVDLRWNSGGAAALPDRRGFRFCAGLLCHRRSPFDESTPGAGNSLTSSHSSSVRLPTDQALPYPGLGPCPVGRELSYSGQPALPPIQSRKPSPARSTQAKD